MFKEIKVNKEDEWLELRSKVLTATDIGVILGLNKYTSVSKMLEEKLNPTPLNVSYVYIGTILESAVVKMTNKALNKNFSLYENDSGKSFFINEELKLGATPDAYDDIHLLECKSTNPKNHLEWYNWPPSNYLIQLYAQLICTDRKEGLLSISSTNLTQHSRELNLPLHIFSLKRNNKIDDIILKEVFRFWKAINEGKKFKVNRKQTPELEIRLRCNIHKIY